MSEEARGLLAAIRELNIEAGFTESKVVVRPEHWREVMMRAKRLSQALSTRSAAVVGERWGENLTAEQWRDIAAKNLDCAAAERQLRLKAEAEIERLQAARALSTLQRNPKGEGDG